MNDTITYRTYEWRARPIARRTIGMRTFAFLFLAACSGKPDAPADSGAMQAHDDGGRVIDDDGGNDGAPMMTLAHDIQPIFDSACTRCHSTRTPFLTKTSARNALAGTSACTNEGARIPYIVPGHPEQSFLFFKIGGETVLSPVGTDCAGTMPSDGPSLAKTNLAAVERVRQWILSGAE